MNNKVIILMLVLLSGFGIGYYFLTKEDKTNTNSVNSITYESKNNDFSNYEEKEVEISSDTNVYKITEGGVYKYNGTINGYISVDTTEDVKIILDNVNITNTNGPCIYGINSNNIYIELIGENTLTDGSTYTGFDEEIKSAIFSNDDLVFTGSGKLTINANYNDAISSDDDIVFENGTYIITSKDDAINGKDSVVIENGNFTINAGGDGIKSTNDTETDKGYILIKNGTFDITSVNDSIQAVTNIEIDNGDFKITSGGGNPGNTVKSGFNNTKTTSESAKGIKAGINILIKNINANINSKDDAIHSNDIIQIDGGVITISSYDDGIHADGLVTINNGKIDITASEGIEATYVKINDGTINISASDDGINAGNKTNKYTTTVEINGGNITIKMGSGDTDGIDSNGNININGGTINITGNSAFDYDGQAKYNGGTIIVNGQTTNTITNQFGGNMQRGGMNNGNMPNDSNMQKGRMNRTTTGGSINERGRI